jgi:hypothetical protein
VTLCAKSITGDVEHLCYACSLAAQENKQTAEELNNRWRPLIG